MQLRNHIAYKFLMDDDFLNRLFRVIMPEEMRRLKEGGVNNLAKDEVLGIGTYGSILLPKNQKAYYITNTVHNLLGLIKVKNLDWNIFNQVDKKYTFIFTQSRLLRVNFRDTSIDFFYLGGTNEDKLSYLQFFIDRKTGIASTELRGLDDTAMKLESYRLLCFFFFSQNEERIVSPGKSYGTRKQDDALSNDLNVPVTIVNSNWNITSIRTEGFNVSGHFRLQPCGPQFSDIKMIFIEPFKKNGYVRRATKELQEI